MRAVLDAENVPRNRIKWKLSNRRSLVVLFWEIHFAQFEFSMFLFSTRWLKQSNVCKLLEIWDNSSLMCWLRVERVKNSPDLHSTAGMYRDSLTTGSGKYPLVKGMTSNVTLCFSRVSRDMIPAVLPQTAHIDWSARTSYISCGGRIEFGLGIMRVTVKHKWHMLPARQNSPPGPLASTFDDTVNIVCEYFHLPRLSFLFNQL